MADTSLIFNVIARDSGLGRVLDKIGSGFRGAGRDAEEALNKASSGTENLDRQIEEAKTRVRELSAEFERTGDKTLFGKINRDRSLITQLTKIRDELRRTKDESNHAGTDIDRMGGIFSRVAGGASSFGSSLVSAGSSAAGMLSSISGLIMAALGLAAFQTVAAPAIYAFGGAAAAIPAMLSGAIAAIATLKLGLSGLSENWEAMNAPKTGGGGGGGAAPVDMTPKIRAVESAQRDVTRTARDYTDAQKELTRAHADVGKAMDIARERLSDLNREWRQAKVDQEEATQGVEQAEMDLRMAQARGNPDEIQKAQLALEKQKLSLEAAADKTDDLGKEYTDAAKKGINGSDEVVAAREREAEAQRKVSDAAEAHRLAIQRLGDAQADLKRKMDQATAGGGALAAQLPKIASNAQAFLDELKRLKPAFDDLRLDIQQRLFDGLAGKLRVLAERWLPALHKGLGGMADMMNGVIKTAFDSLSRQDFISNIMVGLSHFTDMLGKIGRAIAGPLIDAFGRLTRAAAPILDVIGDKVSGIIVHFADWIRRMDESGALGRFMDKAAHIFGTIFDMLEDIGRIAGSVISILFGTNLGSTDSWDAVANALDKVADFLADPKHQKTLAEFANLFGGFAFQVFNLISIISKIPDAINSAIAWFKALPQNASAFMSQLPGIITRFASNAASQLGYWIGYGIGWAIRTIATLPSKTAQLIAALPGVFARIGPWLLNAMGTLYPAMLAIGHNIVVGMWNGIAGMASWLYDRARNFAEGIWKGIQSALHIGSPSRVMADKVGHWIPAGIALGMDNNRGAVQAAVKRLSDFLAGSSLAAPRVGLDEAMAAASGTLTVAARRQRVEVVTRLDVTGADGEFKKLVRSMARTSNLYQGQAA